LDLDQRDGQGLERPRAEGRELVDRKPLIGAYVLTQQGVDLGGPGVGPARPLVAGHRIEPARTAMGLVDGARQQ
jgi:hypothetical protein